MREGRESRGERDSAERMVLMGGGGDNIRGKSRRESVHKT